MSNDLPLFSSSTQMAKIQQVISNYLRLPFALDTIPGSLLEAILGNVREAEVLKTYDFADVIKRGSVGWQVKSTKSSTPVTWMRAKIPDKQSLIANSENREEGRQALGDAIIAYCNAHARHSMQLYELHQIGYSRLVLFPDGRIMYFERSLISRENPQLFNSNDYEWQWSVPKNANKKEQLPAFVGKDRKTSIKHFAWHGRGENQLHFSGEHTWWPSKGDPHRIDFRAPDSTSKIDFETIAEWLTQLPVAEAEGETERNNALPIWNESNGGTAFPT